MAPSFASNNEISRTVAKWWKPECGRPDESREPAGRKALVDPILCRVLAYTIDPRQPGASEAFTGINDSFIVLVQRQLRMTYNQLCNNAQASANDESTADATELQPFGIYDPSLTKKPNVSETDVNETHTNRDRVKVQLAIEKDARHTPNITIEFECSWGNNRHKIEKHKSRVKYWHGNIEQNKSGDELDTVLAFRQVSRLEDISCIENYPDIDVEGLEKLLKKGCLELQIKCKGWNDDRFCSGYRMHAQDSAYGPFLAEMAAIRQRLEMDHVVRILIHSGHDSKIASCFEAIQKNWMSNALLDWFILRSGVPVIDSDHILPDAMRPQYSASPRITYVNGDEGLLIEFYAQLFECEHADNTARQKIIVGARFVQMPQGLVVFLDHSTARLAGTRNGVYEGSSDSDDGSATAKASIDRIWAQITEGVRIMMSITIEQSVEEETGHDKLFFNGLVIPRCDIARPRDIMAKLSPTRDPETGEQVNLDRTPLKNSVICISECTGRHETASRIYSQRTWPVTIGMVIDEKALQRSIGQASAVNERFLHDRASRGGAPDTLEMLLCGVRFDRLGSCNIYDGVDADLIAHLETECFAGRDDLKAGIDVFKNAPGGLVLLHGYAGSGKSHSVLQYLHPLWLQHIRDPHYNCKILVASPMNANVDAMVQKFGQLCSKDKKRPVIVRVYALVTDRQIARPSVAGVDPSKRRREKTSDDIESLILQAKGYGLALIDHVERNTQGLPGILDRRVVKDRLKSSLGWQVLEASGIIDPQKVVTEKVFVKFKNCHRALLSHMKMKAALQEAAEAKKGPRRDQRPWHVLDERQLQEELRLNTEFDAAYDLAAAQVLRNADVVVTTLAQATDARLTDNFKPTIMVFEESSKAETLPVLALMAKHRVPCIMLGDTLQIAPRGNAPTQLNAFAKQIPMTLFSRLFVCGLPHIDVEYNERFSSGLCDFISKVFCHGKLKLSPRKLALESQPSVQDDMDRVVMALSAGTELIGKRIIGIKVPSKEAKGQGETRYNVKMATATWQTFELMVSSGGTKPKDCAMITNYRGERELLTQIRRRLIEVLTKTGQTFYGHSPETLEEILIETPDKCQGGERDYVIYDTTITTTPGSMEDEARVFTGFSRARKAVIFMLDPDSLNSYQRLYWSEGETLVWRIWSKLMASEAVIHHSATARLQQQYTFVEQMASKLQC